MAAQIIIVMRSNEQSLPESTLFKQYGGTCKPYARTLRLQSMLAALAIALHSHGDQPLTDSHIRYLYEIAQFAVLESTVVAEEIEQIAQV